MTIDGRQEATLSVVATVYQRKHVDGYRELFSSLAHAQFSNPMSMIEDLACYTIAFCVFLAITSLAWISSQVDQVFEQEVYRNEEEMIGERSPSLTEHESDDESSETDEDSPDEQNQTLRITIKFLNETQKSLLVNSNDSISKIKRLYFADHLGSNQIIRFIYQGQELQDSRTLHQYDIGDQTIIHCQITTRRRSRSNSHTELSQTLDDSSPIRISLHFILLSTLALSLVWYLRVQYRILFTPISTILLILITIVFGIFAFGPLVSPSSQRASTQFD